jgi:hypothetical protein
MGCGGIAPLVFTSALDAGELSELHAPTALPPGKEPLE